MSYDKDIRENLVPLTEKLTNLPAVLRNLMQANIISTNERDEIMLITKTHQHQNEELLLLMKRKSWRQHREFFLEILKETQNDQCAAIILGQSLHVNIASQNRIETKWYPEKKRLIRSLYERKSGERLLIEILHEKLSTNSRRMAVICESKSALKLSGLGGIGKTLTAKWYANRYESEYENVIWIDCGEDSLLKSFKNLTRDLDVQKRREFHELLDFARGCFTKLSKIKCLWIFDNADCYNGIHMVLPSNEKYFHCLVTSRCGEDWGSGQEYGKLAKLELDVFDPNESISFMKTHLDGKITSSDYQIKQLCELMGNLPLALQLTVAALNSLTLDVQSYIEQLIMTDKANIVDQKFSDYERTINNNVQVSLNLIRNEPNGELAYKIFMIFGYIRPDDVQSEFIRQIVRIGIQKYQAAIDLLKKYSLLTKSGEETCYDGVFNTWLHTNPIEMDLISTHRLLQQVIRHNGKETKNNLIEKILTCKGFLDYKLLPYLYADASIRDKFKNIRAQLIDQFYLEDLLVKRRFQEAVELSRFIHQEIKNEASNFNYALCLDMNGETEEALKLFKEIHEKAESKPEKTESFNNWMVPFTFRPSKFYIAFVLFLQSIYEHRYCTEIFKNYTKKNQNAIKFEIVGSYSQGLFESLNFHLIDGFTIHRKKNFIALKMGSQTNKLNKCFGFSTCKVSDRLRLPIDLTRLDLQCVKFINRDGEQINNFDISNLIPPQLDEIRISSNCVVSLSSLVKIEKIMLTVASFDDRSIISEIKRPQWIRIVKNQEQIKNLNLNDFLPDVNHQSIPLALSTSSSSSSFVNDNKFHIRFFDETFLDAIPVVVNTLLSDLNAGLLNRLAAKLFITKELLITVAPRQPGTKTVLDNPFAKLNEGKETKNDAEHAKSNKKEQKSNLQLSSANTSNGYGRDVELAPEEHLTKLDFFLFDTENIVSDSIPSCVLSSSFIILYISDHIASKMENEVRKKDTSILISNTIAEYISPLLSELKPKLLIINTLEGDYEVNEVISKIGYPIPNILVKIAEKKYYFKNLKSEVMPSSTE